MTHPEFPNLFVVDHPLIQHKLSYLRDKDTGHKLFRELVHEITLLVGYEACRSMPMEDVLIQTPLESCNARRLAGKKPVIFPILRAALGMVDAFLQLMPSSKVGHGGLYRDKQTMQPVPYYFNVPPLTKNRVYFVLDPMLATGGTAAAAISQLQSEGAVDIRFICLVASPEGVTYLAKEHPHVPVFTATLDRELNERAYILPGLGDAGDRLFGTGGVSKD